MSTDKKIAKITHGDDVWYFKKIDGTHLKSANNREALEDGSGMVWHVSQLRDNPYYEDLRQWLHDRGDIDGNVYLKEDY